MFYLESERLILVQTPLPILRKRLEQETFVADVSLSDGVKQVYFSDEFPGDAIVLFPMMIEQYEIAPETLAWGGTLIDRKTHTAIGQIGCKGQPENGIIEIGYGINPSFQKRGYATEMVLALTQWLLEQPSVHTVTAECRKDNQGSIRVLEKSGFIQIGERIDAEDGELFLWKQQKDVVV